MNRDENFNDRKQKSANDDSVGKKMKKKTLANDNATISALSQSLNALSPSKDSITEEAQVENSDEVHHNAEKSKKVVTWVCNWDKDTIMKIWRTPRHYLKTDDERFEIHIHLFKYTLIRLVLKLLLKYNGSYTSYNDIIAQSNKRKGNIVKEGSHVQWEKVGRLVSKDTDYRARQLLREIDRY